MATRRQFVEHHNYIAGGKNTKYLYVLTLLCPYTAIWLKVSIHLLAFHPNNCIFVLF